MQSRRDHVQAYQFAVARLTGAACGGDAVTGEMPARRSHQGVVFGAVLGSLLCAGLLVYGLISPKPSTSWKDAGAIIVDEATGTRYVYLDGLLRPTANYASALLIAGQQAKIQMVPASSLTGVPVGSAIGIPGAPDSVPAASALLPGTWALCERGGSGDASALYLDLAPTGRSTTLPASSEVLAEQAGSAGTEYVIWGATRYPVTDKAALPALGLGTREPVQVPKTWLDQLPEGPALGPSAVPEAGKPGPAIGGETGHVGQTYEITGAGTVQYYVLRSDGLEPISRTEAALYSAVPGALPAISLTPAQFASAPVSADRSLLTELPDVMSGTAYPPADAQSSGADGPALCVQQKSPGRPADSVLATESPAVGEGGSVLVPPDQGMLVEGPNTASLAASDGLGADATPTGVSLVTDTGEVDSIADSEALDSLGYSGTAVQVLPDEVLDLIPTGPVLAEASAQEAAGAQ